MSVDIAIDVKDGQNIDVHLVKQAGHLRITAVGGQSLRKLKRKQKGITIKCVTSAK